MSDHNLLRDLAATLRTPCTCSRDCDRERLLAAAAIEAFLAEVNKKQQASVSDRR